MEVVKLITDDNNSGPIQTKKNYKFEVLNGINNKIIDINIKNIFPVIPKIHILKSDSNKYFLLLRDNNVIVGEKINENYQNNEIDFWKYNIKNKSLLNIIKSSCKYKLKFNFKFDLIEVDYYKDVNNQKYVLIH